ncbi:agmatinase [uncultured Selenomonas sp.]|uniref:agmatinase n=1 Tax=uncultured Selenomonas sp. TaxID=159275 RepID=UPI0028EF6990|nr:agmatinase [uncultured Selenomonas sp.]
MWNRNIETFLGCDGTYEDSHIVIFGAPFDSTTSYRPGTRFAARTMRAESYGLETYSPYQELDLEDALAFDGGDLELPFGDTKRALDMIHTFTKNILTDGRLPFLIGGEHLVSLPAIKAAAEKHPDLAVIHFDAHTDLRDEYLGNHLSHATVIRRVWDFLGDGRIHQFGIRSGERAEWQWARAGHTNIHPFTFSGLSETISGLKDRPVYLTIDLDVLDPSSFPGTGTPEAGGVTFVELMKAALSVIRGCHIVACDMVELSPPLDPSGTSTATALKLLREMILALEADFIRPQTV